MSVIIPIRQYLLLFAAALSSATALASQTYDGNLKPDNGDALMPVVVELQDLGELLSGTVKVSAPLNATAPLDFGRNELGQCNMTMVFSRFVRLRLYGHCDRKEFKGFYTLYYGRNQRVSHGSFTLAGKSSKPDVALSPLNVTGCVKANTKCLAACPRDDESIALLCSSHCRTRFLACKDKAGKSTQADE